jgi:hypothetical protein
MILAHIWNIGTGIGATLVVVAFLYLVGLAAIPQKCIQCLSKPSNVLVWGAFVSILWCWYGIKLNSPLPRSLEALALITCLSLAFRRRALALHSPLRQSLRSTPYFIGAYATFYTLSYVFLTPPASADYLPLARILNNDIFNYFIITQYLQKLGTSNIAGFSHFDTTFTPGVFIAIQGVATVLRVDTMTAAMPTVFGTTAVLGCAAAKLVRSAFNLPKLVACGIVVTFICGPFFRYIVGNYFLSSLIGMVFVILLLAYTVSDVASNTKHNWTQSVAFCLPLYVIIFYCYPPLFAIAVGVQLGFIAVHTLLFCMQREGARFDYVELWRVGRHWVKTTIFCIVILALIDVPHFLSMWQFLAQISNNHSIGWPLDLISPAAIFGFPSPIQVHGRTRQIIGVVVSLVIMSFILYRYWKSRKAEHRLIGFALFAITVLALFFYFLYFYRSGPTYQQWKVASYLPQLLSVCLLGAVFQLISGTKFAANKYKQKSLLAICAVMAIGNVAVDKLRQSQTQIFSSKYENLKALDMLGGANDIYVKMSSLSTSFFAAYFVQHKTLHLLSDSYYLKDVLDIREVSRNKPLFLEGDSCGADERNVTITNVGCLYYSPPSLEYGKQYNLGAVVPGIASSTGLSNPEGWGTWSNANDVQLKILLSPDSVPKNNPLYLNVEVQPFIVGPVKNQRVTLSWGKNSRADKVIDQQEWVSLPYVSNDVSNASTHELALRVHIPDAFSPHMVDKSSPDTRLLGVAFLKLSVTSAPMGGVPAMSDAASHPDSRTGEAAPIRVN